MKILGFAGSLRKGSFNKALLQAAAEVALFGGVRTCPGRGCGGTGVVVGDHNASLARRPACTGLPWGDEPVTPLGLLGPPKACPRGWTQPIEGMGSA